MGDTDRFQGSVEKRLEQLEVTVASLKVEVEVQKEHIKALGALHDGFKDINKGLQELRLEFVKLKTQILTIASVPGALVIAWEVIKAITGK